MNIAIYGPGRMGSLFAYHLARAGHDVTVIGRGRRLEQVMGDQGIVAADGSRAAVRAAAALDPATAYDAVLVTMFATQVEAILPALQASRAKTIIFMFNTFKSLAPLRDAVGAARFAFAFPALPSRLVDGKLQRTHIGKSQRTAVTDEAWAGVFNAAGIPSDVCTDMESYLRAHAAAVVPMMTAGCLAVQRGSGITWEEARIHAQAMAEGFDVVRHLGHPLIPAPIAITARLPNAFTAGLLWLLSRTAPGREVGELGTQEPFMLIDEMLALATTRKTPALQRLRKT